MNNEEKMNMWLQFQLPYDHTLPFINYTYMVPDVNNFSLFVIMVQITSSREVARKAAFFKQVII